MKPLIILRSNVFSPTNEKRVPWIPSKSLRPNPSHRESHRKVRYYKFFGKNVWSKKSTSVHLTSLSRCFFFFFSLPYMKKVINENNVGGCLKIARLVVLVKLPGISLFMFTLFTSLSCYCFQWPTGATECEH